MSRYFCLIFPLYPLDLLIWVIVMSGFICIHYYTFVCKRHYISILSKELGLNPLPRNPTYNIMDLSASEVLDNHKSVLTSFGIETSDDELDLPYIYCIQGKFRPRFIFALFALWHEGEFKTGLIELYIKKYVRKLESGRIQNWANQYWISVGRK